MLLFLTFSLLLTSCNKDSELFEEYVVQNEEVIVEDEGDVNVNDSPIDSELKAFPGAEGFGKFTTGGRGGQVIEVTNLNDRGSGSLRAAIETSGPRTIVFKVAGYITVNSTLTVNNGDLTIAGQTAPGDGITIRRSSDMDQPALLFRTSNIIVRGIRVRAGRGRDREYSGDAASLIYSNNMIFDHCSFSWSTDEVIDPSGSTDVTFQNCIFSEGLMYASHQYSTDPSSSGYYNPHSMGMIIGAGANRITIFKSIFAHNNQRNPLVGGDAAAGSEFELVNNIYYNWGLFGTVFENGSNVRANLINNLYIPGPDSHQGRYSILISNRSQVYAMGNINNYRTTSSAPEWDAIGNAMQSTRKMSSSNQMSNPFDYPLRDESLMNDSDLLNLVTNIAGAFVKDQVDLRVIGDIFNRTGSLIDDPSEVGGYPNLQSGNAYTDSDLDGMADSWETRAGLNPQDDSDGNSDRNGDGYTNLEEFLHQLALEKLGQN